MMKTIWEEKFEKFHAANPQVYALFCRFAMETLDAGYPKVPAGLVMDRVRWEGMMSVRHTDKSPYKINQNFGAYYARQFMKDHPFMGRVFNTRETRAPLSGQFNLL